MPTCQSCRQKTPDGSKHCPHCGAAIAQVPRAEAKHTVFGYAANPADQQQQQQSPSPPSPVEVGSSSHVSNPDAVAKTMLASDVQSIEAQAAGGPVAGAQPNQVVSPDAALPKEQDIKWGGSFQVRDVESNTVVSGRVYGRFIGTLPAEQEQPLRIVILSTVNATLATAQIPLSAMAARLEDFLAQVHSQLAPQLQPMGVTGKVTDLTIVPDEQPTEAAPARAAPAALPGGGFPIKKVALIVGAALFATIAAGVFYTLKGKFLGKGRGSAGYGQFGIDPAKAKADSITEAAAKLARRWNKRSVWWAVDVHKVGVDGVLSFTEGSTAKYTFIVPSRVMSKTKRGRRDSIKKIRFGPKFINHGGRLYAKKRWKNVQPLPAPQCTIGKLARELKQHGLEGDKKVRISFDPTFAFGPGAPKEPSWRVRGQDPKIDAWFSLSTCKLTLDRAARANVPQNQTGTSS